MNKNEIVIFETEDQQVKLPVNIENETVWLSANQMAILFERDEKTIRKHINNVFSEMEVDKINNTQKMRVEGVKQLVPFYTLDVIISVGYRVKSKRGVEFRRWANSVLKQYILRGYAVNDNRIKQLKEVIRIMKRTENELDSQQVLSVIEKYNNALNLLDCYDHQNMTRPKGNEASYILKYEECMQVIQSMRFGNESDLFGKEKDNSFKGSIGNIYQSFDGVVKASNQRISLMSQTNDKVNLSYYENGQAYSIEIGNSVKTLPLLFDNILLCMEPIYSDQGALKSVNTFLIDKKTQQKQSLESLDFLYQKAILLSGNSAFIYRDKQGYYLKVDDEKKKIEIVEMFFDEAIDEAFKVDEHCILTVGQGSINKITMNE